MTKNTAVQRRAQVRITGNSSTQQRTLSARLSMPYARAELAAVCRRQRARGSVAQAKTRKKRTQSIHSELHLSTKPSVGGTGLCFARSWIGAEFFLSEVIILILVTSIEWSKPIRQEGLIGSGVGQAQIRRVIYDVVSEKNPACSHSPRLPKTLATNARWNQGALSSMHSRPPPQSFASSPTSLSILLSSTLLFTSLCLVETRKSTD